MPYRKTPVIVSTRLAFLISSLGVLFGAGWLQAAGPVVRFDLANPDVGPFPTDALTVYADMEITGVRIALPVPDCAAEPSTCAEIGLINELDGFNLYPRLTISFTSGIDADTLRSGVFFVWLNDVTRQEAGMRPAGHVSRIGRVLYDPSGRAFAKPEQVLGQHRRYALIVTNAIRDAFGEPAEASPEFAACIARPDGYCGQLGRVVESLRSQFEPNQIVAASLFTTLSATAWMEKARDLLTFTSPCFQPVCPKSVFKFSEITSITSQQQSKSAPSQFTAIPLNLTYMQGVGRMAFGSFRSPHLLNDQMVIPATPTGGADVVLPEELKEIPFVVFLPDRPAPRGGYPVVILGHGSDMFDMQIGNAFAEGNGSLWLGGHRHQYIWSRRGTGKLRRA